MKKVAFGLLLCAFNVMADSQEVVAPEEELQELNRRAEEMENKPSVCIPHEKVYEMVLARMCRDASNASV